MKRKSLLLTPLTMVLCFSTCSQVIYAAPIANENVEQVSADSTVVQPRAVLHLTKSEWAKNNTIEVVFSYSRTDTGDFVGIQSARIGSYSNALYRSVKVTAFGRKPHPLAMMYAIVEYQNINSNEWHMLEVSTSLY